MNKLCFVISHKYYRNYKSFIQYYVDNIKKFYPDSFILIVDNNSENLEDIKNILKNYENLEIIVNDSKSKFEIGAYKEGIKYIRKNTDLRKNYGYYIFSQDNFILKNKFDIKKELTYKNIFACAVNHMYCNSKKENDKYFYNALKNEKISKYILKKLNIYNEIKNFNLCWCSTFILHHSRIKKFHKIIKKIIIEKKQESIDGERYLSGLLYYLNNNKHNSLCGNFIYNDYNWLDTNISCNKSKSFFVKVTQSKP